MSERARKALERHVNAQHAVQSAIRFMLERGSDMASPKHLRVGVDTALSDHGALVRLLISKGVFSEEEYFEAIAEGMEREQERVTGRARRESGIPGLNFA